MTFNFDNGISETFVVAEFIVTGMVAAGLYAYNRKLKNDLDEIKKLKKFDQQTAYQKGLEDGRNGVDNTVDFE